MRAWRRTRTFAACALIGGASLALAQSSVPPLPALPVTLQFSHCDSLVTYTATITDWVRDANGSISSLSATKVVTGSSVNYTYLFWGNFSMTVGSTTQNAI